MSVSLDRFDHELAYRVHATPPEKYPRAGDSGMFCITCGRELKFIEYPDEQEDYGGKSCTVYGGSELYCESGCE